MAYQTNPGLFENGKEGRQKIFGDLFDRVGKRCQLGAQRSSDPERVMTIPERFRGSRVQGFASLAGVGRQESQQPVALIRDARPKAFEPHADVETTALAPDRDDRSRLQLRVTDFRDEGTHARRIAPGSENRRRAPRAADAGETSRVTISPSVPSEPTISLGRSRPADVLDDLAAAPSRGAVGAHQGEADDQIADRSVSRAPRAERVGREDAPHGRALGHRRIERQALAVRSQSLLQSSERRARFDDDDLIGGSMLDDARQARRL